MNGSRPRRHGPGGPGRMNMPGEKAHNFGRSIRKLARFCRPYYLQICIALLCAALSVIFTLLGPERISDLTNLIRAGLFGEMDLSEIGRICILLLFYYGFGALLMLFQGLLMTYSTQKISKLLRREISKKINRLPLGFYHGTTFGDILSRITSDVDTIGESLHRSITTLITSVVMLAGTVFMMFKSSPILALTAILSSSVGFMTMGLITRKSQKHFVQRQKALGDLIGHIEEIYSGHLIVKAYNGESAALARFDELNNRLYNSNWKSQFLSGLMMPIMGFVGNLGYVAVCVFGAFLALGGSINFGTIIAFTIYIRLFSNPLSQLAQVFTSLQSAAAASERVFEFLEENEMSDESGKHAFLADTKGAVEFDHVRFGYDADRIVIKDFSCSIKPGQKVAIVGPTGAGKTTLVNLLMRFYELNSGEIRIDGIPTHTLTRANIHDLFGMVLQDTWLFEGSVRDNIAYSKENATDDQIESACKAAGIHRFIMTLPNGYDTVLNESVTLSEGQKQLLTIARAMVENAPMLILDEATSSVDTRTEMLIQRAMDRLSSGRTSFVIAHRLSTIKNADLILVLKDGDIIESGNHEDLLAQNGFYAELYNSQFEQAS